jgi:hypothetical protein
MLSWLNCVVFREAQKHRLITIIKPVEMYSKQTSSIIGNLSDLKSLERAPVLRYHNSML